MKKTKLYTVINSLKQIIEDSGQLSLASKRKTALSLAVGFYLGLFPLIGTTTVLCLLVSFVFRLNILILQAYNIVLAPVQLFAAYLFLKAGRWIFFADKEIIPAISFHELIHTPKWESLLFLLKSAAGGVFVWALFFASTGFLLNKVILKLLNSRKYYP